MKNILYLLFLCGILGHSQVRYITASANGIDDGTSEINSWNWTQAMASQGSWTELRVKAGSYTGIGELVFSSSGTSGTPKKIIGYTTTPGDIVSVAYSTFDEGDTPTTSNMPVLEGSTPGASSTTARIKITGNYIEVYNIVAYKAGIGFYADGDNFVLDNCVAYEIGRPSDEEYYGEGFRITGNNGQVKNCHAEKNQMFGYWAHSGTGTTWENNEMINKSTSWETDYMFQVSSASNVIDGLRCLRGTGLTHTSRVLSFKNTTGSSTVSNVYGENSRLEFYNSDDNVIDGVTILGHDNSNTNFNTSGSNNNEIRNAYIETAGNAVVFGAAGTGGNKFINCIFKNNGTATYGVLRVLASATEATNTLFLNCVFDDFGNDVVDLARDISGIKFINCNFVNCAATQVVDDNGFTPTSFEFTNNNRYNTVFTWPTGSGYTGNISVNPEFTGTSTNADVYKLQSTSSLINAGVTNANRTTDFDGNSFEGTPDIGPFEYQTSGEEIPTVTLATLKAFPTAEGFGKNTTGGRGGTVVVVTNLDDSGTGSLREAMTSGGGDKTIVFDIGGTIDNTRSGYSGVIDCAYDNITIAGQTALGDGILLKGIELRMGGSNYIVRGVSFMQESASTSSNLGEFILNPVATLEENAIIDHCSFAWEKIDGGTYGKQFAVNGQSAANYNFGEVTVQNCIFSEGQLPVLLYQGSRNVTFYQNYFAFNQERNIRSNHPFSGTFEFEMVNNIIFGAGTATQPSLGTKFSVVNNEYKNPPTATLSASEAVVSASADTGTNVAPAGEGYAYITGNIYPAGKGEYSSSWDPYIEVTPFADGGVIDLAVPAVNIAADLLPHVGNSFQSRNAHDAAMVQHYYDNDGTRISGGTFGTYPTISGGTSITDTNTNYIPDSFESDHGITSASDVIGTYDFGTYQVINDAGYSAFEIYLSWKAGDFDRMEKTNTPIESYPGGDSHTDMIIMMGF